MTTPKEEKKGLWSKDLMSNERLPKGSLLRRPEFGLVEEEEPAPEVVPVEKDPDYDVMCKLVEIFEDTERYDKLKITLDTVSRNVTIIYEDLDDEWFHELLTL